MFSRDYRSLMLAFSACMLLLFPAGCEDEFSDPPPEPTDGTRYNETTFLTSHNAFAYFDWADPIPDHGMVVNQQHSIETQLHNGVRALMLDVYWWNEPEHPLRSADAEAGTWQVWLCHGQAADDLPEPCSQLIFSPLHTELEALVRFLEFDDSAFVTIMLEDSVNDEERLVGAFDAVKFSDGSSLMDRAWNPRGDVWNVTEKGEWPFVEWLVWKGLRVVIFAGGYDALSSWGSVGLGNQYDSLTPGDLDPYIREEQKDPNKQLLLMNHFSGPKMMNGWDAPGVSTPYAVADVNDYDYTLARVLEGFLVETGRLPNFLAFDFVDGIPLGQDICDDTEIACEGPLSVVEELNRVHWPVVLGEAEAPARR